MAALRGPALRQQVAIPHKQLYATVTTAQPAQTQVPVNNHQSPKPLASHVKGRAPGPWPWTETPTGAFAPVQLAIGNHHRVAAVAQCQQVGAERARTKAAPGQPQPPRPIDSIDDQQPPRPGSDRKPGCPLAPWTHKSRTPDCSVQCDRSAPTVLFTVAFVLWYYKSAYPQTSTYYKKTLYTIYY